MNNLKVNSMLKTRLLTSLILITIFLIALFNLSPIQWAIFMLIIVVASLWEWSSIAKFNKSFRYLYTVLTVLLCLTIVFCEKLNLSNLQNQAVFWAILASVIFWILFAPVWLFLRFPIKNPILLSFLGWLLIVPMWFAMMSLRQINPWFLLATMGTVWIADTTAYFVGKRYGKNKLAPSISPGKTWEGVVGALIAVSCYGGFLCYFLRLNIFIILGLWLVTILSIMGDLIESLIKRQAEIKDSGNLLPGHGGMLDRIDGLTSTLPVVTFFVYFPVYYMNWFNVV